MRALLQDGTNDRRTPKKEGPIMTWVRIDESFPEHPKVLAAGGDAAWLHVCALAYCNRFLTDGVIPGSMLTRLSDRKRPTVLATKLVEVGLWEITDAGWTIHDFLSYQPSKAIVEAEKAKARERMAKARSSPDVRPNKSPNFARSSPNPIPSVPSDPSPPDSSSSSSVLGNGDGHLDEDEDERIAHAIEIHAAWRARKADDPPAYAPKVQVTDRRTKLPDLTDCLRKHPTFTAHQLASTVFTMPETEALEYDPRRR